MSENSKKVLVLPLRSNGDFVFPHGKKGIYVARDKTVKSLKMARDNGNNEILVVKQKNQDDLEPTIDNVFSVGVISTIDRMSDVSQAYSESTSYDEVWNIALTGLRRVFVNSITCVDGYFEAQITEFVPDKSDVSPDTKEMLKVSKEILEKHQSNFVIPNGDFEYDQEEIDFFCDFVISQLIDSFDNNKKLYFFAEVNPVMRLEELFSYLSSSVADMMEVDVEDDGDSLMEDIEKEIEQIGKRIKDLEVSPEVKKVLSREYKRLRMMQPSSSEYHVIYNYIDTMLSIPWNNYTDDNLDVKNAEKVLDEDHWGLEKLKERVLEFLSVKKLSPDKAGAILCFVGPPGVGKTSIAKSIARSMDRKYVRMSLGGVHDEAEIRGHRKTYIGAMAGRIITGLISAEVMNPVFTLDEIDKLGKDHKGDPSAALLEVLDPEQNFSFNDNYLGVPLDLSKVMFIATANDASMIPRALYDRMEVIDVSGYSPFDKEKIAQHHLVPKQKEENGLKEYEVSFTSDAINTIVEDYTFEAGVRTLERKCGKVLRKVAVLIASDEEYPNEICSDLVKKYLGPPRGYSEKMNEKPEVGLCAGLAATSNGGHLLFIESTITSSKKDSGKILCTGNLGETLQESAQLAHTWIKSQGLPVSDLLDKNDIHIHLPAGGTPKDGSSAGVALTVSVYSTLSNFPIRNDIAMTGEISLRGNVLPIGGLSRKVMAAHRAGIRHVLLPEKNMNDLEDVPEDIKKDMKFTPLTHVKEALDILLIKENNIEVALAN